MIDKTAIVELLGNTQLFGSLEETDQRAVADEMREVSFATNQVIFARGDAGREIYLVVNGRVRLSVLSAEGRELSFAHAEPGAIFGEIAMLDGGTRTADATAFNRVERNSFQLMVGFTHARAKEADGSFSDMRVRVHYALEGWF